MYADDTLIFSEDETEQKCRVNLSRDMEDRVIWTFSNNVTCSHEYLYDLPNKENIDKYIVEIK